MLFCLEPVKRIYYALVRLHQNNVACEKNQKPGNSNSHCKKITGVTDISVDCAKLTAAIISLSIYYLWFFQYLLFKLFSPFDPPSPIPTVFIFTNPSANEFYQLSCTTVMLLYDQNNFISPPNRHMEVTLR
ncbi:hypothetical protein JOB18_020125 [Solea senegalensis]|uniref:Vomeronasal type-1 receptor n=1 Tax=Solea senegalensis TaxID=28829 RepID=A0AAV6ST35_SOLSE|nr:hypothetical protein JOB18_020125 [Solea senegalensis]